MRAGPSSSFRPFEYPLVKVKDCAMAAILAKEHDHDHVLKVPEVDTKKPGLWAAGALVTRNTKTKSIDRPQQTKRAAES